MKIVKRVKGYGITCDNCHTTFEASNEELTEKTEQYYYGRGIDERAYHMVDCPQCGKSLRVEYSDNYLLYENIDIEV